MLGLHKIGIHRLWAILIIFLGLGIFVSYPLVRGIPVLVQESQKIQYYAPKLERYVRLKYGVFKTKIKQHIGIEVTADVAGDAIKYAKESGKNILLGTTKFFTSLLEWLILVPLFLFFILQDGVSFKKRLLKLVPNPIFERAYYIFHQFNKQFGDYIFAKCVEASIIGTIITTGLLIIGFPFAFLLGFIAAITNVVPYIGPVLGFLPVAAITIIDGSPNATIGAVVLLYAIANVFDLALVFPILVSKIVNLHPVLVVISVIVGSQYWGVLGMVISIPIAAVVKLLFAEIQKEVYSRGYR